MRVLAVLAAVLLLAGCDGQSGTTPPQDSFGGAEGVEKFANSGSGFDYRYAFRLRSDRLKAVLESNSAGCVNLGPSRCRIVGSRYQVSDSNQVKAVLTLRIDPSIARDFGEAAVKALQSADGVLVDSEVAGADSTTTARSLAMIDQLRAQLKAAQAQAATSNDAKSRAQRIQSALDTIAEVQASQGQTLATSPMLITYESSTAFTGLGSADANFRNAGQSLENSVARLLVVLATLGPWLIALVVIIALLRFMVHGTGRGGGEDEPVEEHDEHDQRRHDNRNLISRWFNRDDDNGHGHEQEQQPHG